MMDKIARASIVATVAFALSIALQTIAAGQSLKEAEKLFEQSTKLYNAGKYAEAVPLAQRVLAIKQKCSVRIIQMSDNRYST